jgi:hypothetical protein
MREINKPAMICAVCEEPTDGVRGPATGYLRPLCLPCATALDAEAEAAAIACGAMMRSVDSILLPVIECEVIQ